MLYIWRAADSYMSDRLMSLAHPNMASIIPIR